MNFTPPSPLLVLEASTGAGSVALFVDGVLAGERDVVMGPSRDDAMLPAIADVLHEAGLRAADVRAIACGSGPGSFTSLRIAASLAKGLAVANNAALFAIPSLLLSAAALVQKPGRYVLHSDALRGERYVLLATVGSDGTVAAAHATARMPLASVEALADVATNAPTLVAIGATTVSSRDASSQWPHARSAAVLFPQWSSFGPVPVDAWEPEYGRLAEAQVKWETAHGQALPAS